nr:hypothetical protein [Tanacetum cinerariifolium]
MAVSEHFLHTKPSIGIVIVESGVRLTTRSAAHMGSSSIGSEFQKYQESDGKYVQVQGGSAAHKINYAAYLVIKFEVTLSWRATRVLESGTTVVKVVASVVVGVGISVVCCREGKSDERREVMVVVEAIVTVSDGLMTVCSGITKTGMVRSDEVYGTSC